MEIKVAFWGLDAEIKYHFGDGEWQETSVPAYQLPDKLSNLGALALEIANEGH